MTALLSSSVAVCDEKRVAKKEHPFFHCCGKLFCSREKMFKNRRRNQWHNRIMFFRHNKKMSFCSRVDIKNREELVIFVNFFARNFSFDNFAEGALCFLAVNCLLLFGRELHEKILERAIFNGFGGKVLKEEKMNLCHDLAKTFSSRRSRYYHYFWLRHCLLRCSLAVQWQE